MAPWARRDSRRVGKRKRGRFSGSAGGHTRSRTSTRSSSTPLSHPHHPSFLTHIFASTLPSSDQRLLTKSTFRGNKAQEHLKNGRQLTGRFVVNIIIIIIKAPSLPSYSLTTLLPDIPKRNWHINQVPVQSTKHSTIACTRSFPGLDNRVELLTGFSRVWTTFQQAQRALIRDVKSR